MQGAESPATTVMNNRTAMRSACGLVPLSTPRQRRGDGMDTEEIIGYEALYNSMMEVYERYMDDSVMIHNEREKLETCLEVIERKLAEKDMKLNKKKTKIYSLRKGILFLGFWFYLTDTGKVMVHIDPRKVKHERRKLRRMAGLVKKGEKTREQVDEHFDSWMRHASYGDSYNFQKNMREFYRSLWEDNDNDGVQETQWNDRG